MTPVDPPRAETTAADAKVRALEIVISRLLRSGVILSLLLVVGGTAISFSRNAEYRSGDQATLEEIIGPSARFPHTPGAVASGVIDLRGEAIVALGLLVLMATPVLRVAVSVAAFAYQGDRVFVGITSIVLVLLVVSFALGRAGG